ncbi:MAG: MFS transporter [Pseudomonadota bacterium]|nr:MFS transporter [Pseudomonadota bacterium]
MPGLELEPGHPQYRRSLLGLFLIGVSTFGLMYTVQPLLPTIGDQFGRNAAEAAWLLSATTLGIAVSVIPLSRVARRLGWARSMQLGLLIAAVGGFGSGVAPGWELLVGARGLMGVGLGFILVSAMAWVADQAASWSFATIGGLYISGTTMGGVLGRLSSGMFAEFHEWHGAILITTALAAGTGVLAHLLLPATPRTTGRAAAGQTAGPDPNRWLRLRMFLVGGFGMAAFVGVYNVTTYRVAGEPFGLGPGFTGLIFLTYLSGTLTSAVVGRWVQRWSIARVMLPAVVVAALGIAITLIDSVWAIVGGLLVLSAGFFAMHAVANAAAARYSPAPSTSSAVYSLAYYLGSSVGGIVVGLAWDAGGWPASALVAVGLLALAGVAGTTAKPVVLAR